MSLITIRLVGDKDTIARLEKLGKSLVLQNGAMKKIGAELTKYFAGQVFASQGGILGEGWTALSPKYQEYKAKHYPGRGPLVQTGLMQRSFEYDANDSSVTITNSAPWFPYHQSTEPRSKLPRRAMMATNNDVKSLASVILQEGIRQSIKKAGF